MEQQAAGDLAEATLGRYFERPHASYRIPTAHYHFQAADALALAPDFAAPDGAGASGGGAAGSLLLATFDRQGVAAWLVPASGAVQVRCICWACWACWGCCGRRPGGCRAWPAVQRGLEPGLRFCS